MGEWISICGQMGLPLACRGEAENLVKRFHLHFGYLDVDFTDRPDSFLLTIAAYGMVKRPASLLAGMCRLGRQTTHLAQFRVISDIRNDFIFLGTDQEVSLAEMLAYRLDFISSGLSSLSSQQQHELLSRLDDFVLPLGKTGT